MKRSTTSACIAAALFLAICAVGFVTALAGGVAWGTINACACAGTTFVIASFLALWAFVERERH